MSESKHTSGPWHVVEHVGGKPRYWIVTDPETWVHRVGSVADYDDRPNLANARLIAAAPDLLTALQACQGALSMLVARNAIRQTTVANACAEAVKAEIVARSAIGKAIGGI